MYCIVLHCITSIQRFMQCTPIRSASSARDPERREQYGTYPRLRWRAPCRLGYTAAFQGAIIPEDLFGAIYTWTCKRDLEMRWPRLAVHTHPHKFFENGKGQLTCIPTCSRTTCHSNHKLMHNIVYFYLKYCIKFILCTNKKVLRSLLPRFWNPL